MQFLGPLGLFVCHSPFCASIGQRHVENRQIDFICLLFIQMVGHAGWTLQNHSNYNEKTTVLYQYMGFMESLTCRLASLPESSKRGQPCAQYTVVHKSTKLTAMFGQNSYKKIERFQGGSGGDRRRVRILELIYNTCILYYASLRQRHASVQIYLGQRQYWQRACVFVQTGDFVCDTITQHKMLANAVLVNVCMAFL